jgi:hypothetical protein
MSSTESRISLERPRSAKLLLMRGYSYEEKCDSLGSVYIRRNFVLWQGRKVFLKGVYASVLDRKKKTF